MPKDNRRRKINPLLRKKKETHIFKRNGDFSTPHLFFPDLISLVFVKKRNGRNWVFPDLLFTWKLIIIRQLYCVAVEQFSFYSLSVCRLSNKQDQVNLFHDCTHTSSASRATAGPFETNRHSMHKLSHPCRAHL